jgi:TonB family protein
MKILCDVCGTRYSIDDRRVAGKSPKIRCKQCAHIIVLPGPRAPTAEPAAPGTWHAVIDGMPRPIATEDLRRLRAAGVLDDRALVWREGFDDWRELGSVDELRPPSAEVAPDAGSQDRTDAHADAELARGPERAPLRGMRHQNSVLFSLGNLAQLAAPAPATALPTAGTEGSGLLDIRSLARTRAPARSERSAVAEVPVFGALAFGEPAVLIPRPPPRRDRRLIWALATTAGALAIATVILIVLVMRGTAMARTDVPAVPQAPPGAATPQLPLATPASAPATPTAVAHAGPEAAPKTAHAETSTARSSARPDGAASSSATHAAPTATAPTAEHAGAPARAAAASRRASTRAPSSWSSAATASRSAADAAPLAPPAHPTEACSEITCIVNGYADPCCAIYRRPAAGGATTTRAELPGSLDRAAIASGLGRIDTRGCGQQSPAHGDVKVSVKVSPAGAVTDVTVKSSPDPALDACVTAAVLHGTFPATQRGGSFAYMWRF